MEPTPPLMETNCGEGPGDGKREEELGGGGSFSPGATRRRKEGRRRKIRGWGRNEGGEEGGRRIENLAHTTGGKKRGRQLRHRRRHVLVTMSVQYMALTYHSRLIFQVDPFRCSTKRK